MKLLCNIQMLISIFFFEAFQLEICTTMHSTNFNNNPQNRKTSTLDATIKLSDDGSKRTYFIAQDGSKQQSITQNVKSLVPNIEQCKLRINVSFKSTLRLKYIPGSINLLST